MARTIIAGETFGPDPNMRLAVRRQVLAALWNLPAGLVRRMAAARAERRRVRRAIAELSGLSDRMLRDIAVERHDIDRIARHGRDASDIRS